MMSADSDGIVANLFVELKELNDELDRPSDADVKTIELSSLNQYANLINEVKITLIGSTYSPNTKKSYETRLKFHVDELAKFRKQSLVGSGDSRFKSDNTSLSRSVDSLRILQNSHKQLIDSERVGIDTLHQLNKQRDQFNFVKNNLGQINQELTLSNKIINKLKSWWRS